MTSTSHYDVPVTYVKCTADEVVMPEHQQKMINDFRKVSRREVEVVEVKSGHCPMVGCVERTAEVIMEAAGREGVECFSSLAQNIGAATDSATI